jgi:hypothetical protein
MSNFGQDVPVEPQSPIFRRSSNFEKTLNSATKRTISERMNNLPKLQSPLNLERYPRYKRTKSKRIPSKRCNKRIKSQSNHRSKLNA